MTRFEIKEMISGLLKRETTETEQAKSQDMINRPVTLWVIYLHVNINKKENITKQQQLKEKLS